MYRFEILSLKFLGAMTEGQCAVASCHCALATRALAHSLLDLEQFDLEQEGGVGGDDATCAAAAVPKIGGIKSSRLPPTFMLKTPSPQPYTLRGHE